MKYPTNHPKPDCPNCGARPAKFFHAGGSVHCSVCGFWDDISTGEFGYSTITLGAPPNERILGTLGPQ